VDQGGIYMGIRMEGDDVLRESKGLLKRYEDTSIVLAEENADRV
jgi:hypothetical protein